MNGVYIGQSILIIIIFGLLLLSNYLAIGIKNIQNNWPHYECNPIIMMFSGLFGKDPQQTFINCSNNNNMNFIPYLMEPIKSVISNSNSIGSSISSNLGSMINLSSSTKFSIFSIIDYTFDMTFNLLTVFQLIFIKLSSLFKKVVGVVMVFLHILRSFEIIVPSALMTPPGVAIMTVANSAGAVASKAFGSSNNQNPVVNAQNTTDNNNSN